MKEKFTRKLYFKKFTHRVYLKTQAHFSSREQGPTTDIVKWFMTSLKVDFKTQSSSVEINKNKNYWSRNFDHYITLYFSDPTVLEKIKEEFGDAVKEIEKPRDDEHLKILETERVLTRKELFYKKYRVVCRVEPKQLNGRYFTEHYQEMNRWCLTNLELDTYRVNIPWSGANFFFIDRSTAMLFKLVWGDDIKTTERIILLDEIQQKDIKDA